MANKLCTINGQVPIVSGSGIIVDAGGNLGTKSITANGTYNANNDGYEGYSSVTVNISGSKLITGYHRHCDIDGIWHFPINEWSQTVNGVTYDDNIELIPVSDTSNVLYYLMDVREDYAFCRFRGYGNQITYTVGVCNNGIFTAIDTPTTIATGGYYKKWLSDYNNDGYNFVVIKVESTDPEKQFTNIVHSSWESDGVHTAIITPAYMPILMRYGSMPYGTSITIGTNNIIESDNIKNFASKLTNTNLNISSLYSSNINLARWRCDGWNIKNNYTTSLASVFYNCYLLSDTPDITDMSGWASSRTTSATSFINGCYLWKNPINVSNWDISACTTLKLVIANCYSLKNILNIASWTGTTVATDLSAMFSNNYSLESVDLSGITISSSVTTMASAFSGCQRLKSVKLPAIDFSNMTTIASMFYNCYSLSELTHGVITPSTNKLTTIASIFNGCWTLKETDILKGFNLSNANITTAFSNMKAVIDGDDIDLTNIVAPTISIAYGSNAFCYSTCQMMTHLDYSWFDCSTDSSSSKIMTTSLLYGLVNIVDYYPPQNLQAVNIDISSFGRLSHDSILRIINALPTISTTKTFKLGTVNKPKMTTEEIAIATNKGWSVT